MKTKVIATLFILFISCNQKQEIKSSVTKSPEKSTKIKHEKLLDFSYTKTDARKKLNPSKPTQYNISQIGNILSISFKTSGGNCAFNGDILIKNDSLFLLYEVDLSKELLKEEMNYEFNYKIENKEQKTFNIKAKATE